MTSRERATRALGPIASQFPYMLNNVELAIIEAVAEERERLASLFDSTAPYVASSIRKQGGGK